MSDGLQTGLGKGKPAHSFLSCVILLITPDITEVCDSRQQYLARAAVERDKQGKRLGGALVSQIHPFDYEKLKDELSSGLIEPSSSVQSFIGNPKWFNHLHACARQAGFTE